MADPFEVRMRFTSQLQHLNASSTSALKAANYAIRNAEFGDDLHSCILEQLERNSLNNRANIMYFLPALCDAAKAAGEMNYVRMIERDILLIVDLVAPDDSSSAAGNAGVGTDGIAASAGAPPAAGAANVKVVRKVLQLLHQKAVLKDETVQELEECIVGRERVDDDDVEGVSRHDDAREYLGHDGSADPANSGSAAGARASGNDGKDGKHTKPSTMTSQPQSSSQHRAAPQTQQQLASTTTQTTISHPFSNVQVADTATAPPVSHSRPSRTHHQANIRIDKRQLEQRIEEDRERHKRAREGIWAISQQQGVTNLAHDSEFDTLWDAAALVSNRDAAAPGVLVSDLDDRQMAREEAVERRRYLEYEEVAT